MCVSLIRPGGAVANVGVQGKSVELKLQDLWVHHATITTGLISATATPMLLKPVAQGELPVPAFQRGPKGREAPGARRKGVAWGALLALFLAAPAFAQDASELSDLLHTRLESTGTPPRLVIANEVIYASSLLPVFYDARGFSPAWIDARGPLPVVEDLLDAIRRSADHGLRPSDYHLRLLEQKLADQARGALSTSRLIEVELLATDAFLVYASHLVAGHVDPKTVNVTWFIPRPEMDLVALLQQAASSREIRGALEQVAPSAPAYRRLKGALAEYRSIASRGGWPSLPAGATIRAGDRDARVVALRRRLAVTNPGVLDQTSELLDDDLRRSVEMFQRLHGLAEDGVVGPATWRALNVPVEERIGQIRINLERWRWLPAHLGDRYLLVNIAGFRLYVVENNATMMTMRAIVGRPYRDTPIYSDVMTYLVFSPYWHVPRGIAGRDILPKVQKDLTYLAANGFKVFQGWDSAVAIDPTTVKWESLTRSNLPYRFRQDPGPLNALGRIKFMFPNNFSVYLHDTPSRNLFNETARAFSSGCVRIEQPADLALYLLKDTPGWDRHAIERGMNRRQEQTVRLRTSIPVHLLYWTVWADEDGTLQFPADVYSRDDRLRMALDEAPPER